MLSSLVCLSLSHCSTSYRIVSYRVMSQSKRLPMSPINSSRHSSRSRYSRSRDYRPHSHYDERSRRDSHHEKKRSRYESPRRDEHRHRGSETKRKHDDDDDVFHEETTDPEKALRITMKKRTLEIKRTLAKSFGLSTSRLTRMVTDKCDQMLRESILSQYKQSSEDKRKNDGEPIQNSRTATDEVHSCDDSFRREDEHYDEAPNNDYSQHFVNTGQRPQNFIRDAGLQDRFEEYPKLRELIRLKDEYISKTNCEPMYLRCDILSNNFTLSSLECEFDVILIEPPLEEYRKSNGIHFDRYVKWEDVMKLDVENIAAQRSFLFLWCGSADGLDQGRACLKKWGFRRCEDICWVKTNRSLSRPTATLETGSVFQRTKEHCLMGIKGTVRRSVDSDFIHANVDIDLIITEETEWGDPNKPLELYHIIEHFCLGRRRLHLFARDSTIRRGWLSVGADISTSNFDKRVYKSYFEKPLPVMENLTERIEQLRPKSPPPKGAKIAPGAAPGTTSTPLTNPNSSSSSNIPTKDLPPPVVLQDGQQAIRSTITSNRQSSSRVPPRPHWGLYPDDLPTSVYPPIIHSPPRHNYSSSYSNLYMLSEYDFAIAGGSSSQNDYDTYHGHNNLEQNEERNSFRN